jgi:hypothetical protein
MFVTRVSISKRPESSHRERPLSSSTTAERQQGQKKTLPKSAVKFHRSTKVDNNKAAAAHSCHQEELAGPTDLANHQAEVIRQHAVEIATIIAKMAATAALKAASRSKHYSVKREDVIQAYKVGGRPASSKVHRALAECMQEGQSGPFERLSSPTKRLGWQMEEKRRQHKFWKETAVETCSWKRGQQRTRLVRQRQEQSWAEQRNQLQRRRGAEQKPALSFVRPKSAIYTHRAAPAKQVDAQQLRLQQRPATALANPTRGQLSKYEWASETSETALDESDATGEIGSTGRDASTMMQLMLDEREREGKENGVQQHGVQQHPELAEVDRSMQLAQCALLLAGHPTAGDPLSTATGPARRKAQASDAKERLPFQSVPQKLGGGFKVTGRETKSYKDLKNRNRSDPLMYGSKGKFGWKEHKRRTNSAGRIKVNGTNPLVLSSSTVPQLYSMPEGYRPPSGTVRMHGDLSQSAAAIAMSHAGSGPSHRRALGVPGSPPLQSRFQGEGGQSPPHWAPPRNDNTRLVVALPQSNQGAWTQEY